MEQPAQRGPRAISVSETEENQHRFVRESLRKQSQTDLVHAVEQIAKAPEDDEDDPVDDDQIETSDINAQFPISEEHSIKQAEIRWKVEHTDSTTEVSLDASTDPLVASRLIQFQRVKPALKDGSIMFDSPEEIAVIVLRAMKMRQRYMRQSRQYFPEHLASYLGDSSSSGRLRTVSSEISTQAALLKHDAAQSSNPDIDLTRLHSSNAYQSQDILETVWSTCFLLI